MILTSAWTGKQHVCMTVYVWTCKFVHRVFINNSTTSGAIELCEGMTSMQRDYFCFPFWWLTKGSGPIHSDISSCTCPLLHISFALDIIKTHWHDIYKKSITCPNFAYAGEITVAIQASIHVYTYECRHTSTVSRMCMNIYEIWAYTGTHTYTHPHRYKSPSSREGERKLGCEEMTQRCRCVLLDRSSFSLSSPSFSFTFLYSFDILIDLSSCARKKRLRNGQTVLLYCCFQKHSCRFPSG